MNDTQMKDNIDWNDYFMKVAEVTAKRSKDPRCKVGAVIVNPQKRIIATGYNGMPNCKHNDQVFPWGKGTGMDHKKHFVIHAETNAILNATGSLQKSRMFVTRFPCNECAKLIAQSGIKVIYYQGSIDMCEDSQYMQCASVKIFDHCGVRTKEILQL